MVNKRSKEPSVKVLARQEKIKAVALELFLTKGYTKTSLSDIIKISGGSYSNIYTAYKNKEGLFFEILNDVCKRHFELLNSKIKKSKSKKLEDILYYFGLTYVEIFNQEQTTTFGKIIYSQVYNEDKNLEEKSGLKIMREISLIISLFLVFKINQMTILKSMQKNSQPYFAQC